MAIHDRHSRIIRRAGTGLMLTAALCALSLSGRAQDAMPAAAVEAQKTEAGAIAVDNHWSLAEMTGDTAYLQQMLLPEYRSVNADGKAYSKDRIVAGAAKRSGTDLATAKSKIDAYKKAHPYGTSVVLRGDVAILSFYDPARGAQKGVKSSDIFVYVDGQWHAMYSQHGDVDKG
ncbi:MAG: nuclear transport factor 2 family protein [Rhodanobacter sp.]